MLRLASALAAAGLLAGCTSPKPYDEWQANGLRPFTVDAIKSDPKAFVAANNGKRVLVEGYFGVSQIAESCDFSIRDGNLLVEIDLELPMKTFQSSVFRWVVVSAVVEAPRTRKLGGGDLYIVSSASDQAAILGNASLLAVDEERACLEAKSQ